MSSPARLTQLQALARSRGGRVLSSVLVNSTTKLRFRCAAGHEWLAYPRPVERGTWCPRCAAARTAHAQKLPALAKLRRIVARRGGTLISTEYVDSSSKLSFRCCDNHVWSAAPRSIVQGAWCPVCAQEARRQKIYLRRSQQLQQRLLRIVQRRGGEILPPGHQHSRQPLRLRCAQGHEWEARPAVVERGTWCPRCAGEKLVARFSARAERWGGECLAQTCRSGRQRLQWRCALGHRFTLTGNIVMQGVWCPSCRTPAAGSIERMRQIASDRHGECLSERYVNAMTKLRWRCHEGHEWRTTPAQIVSGAWCPKCRAAGGQSVARLSIGIMRELAAARGGACLSSEYHSVNSPLHWRCARGHTWSGRPRNMRSGGWCPVCSRSVVGTIESMRALANERGGRCVTRKWDDHRKPLAFECGRGHRFEALASVVKTGLWCPICRS